MVVVVVVVVVVCGRRFVEQFGFSRISRRSFLPSDRLPICHLLSSKIFGVSLSFAGAVRFSLFPLAFLLDSAGRLRRRSSQLAVSSRIFSLSFGGILKAKQRERFVPTLPPPTTDDHTTTPPAEREMAKIPGHTLCRPSLMKGWHPIPIPQRKQSL